MKFVNIRHIAKALDLKFNRIDDAFILKIRDIIDNYFIENEKLQISGSSFNYQEISIVLGQLKNEKYRVFYGWVEQDDTLSNYLFSRGSISDHYLMDQYPLKEHQLFDEYLQFLTPFLVPILNKHITHLINNKDLEGLKNHLEFCSLLIPSKRIEIQQPINVFINNLFEEVIQTEGINFQTCFDLVFSHSCVFVLNQLDNTFYSTLVAYADTAKAVVKHKSLNIAQLYKIKTSLLDVKFTPQHQEQVERFCQSDSFKLKPSYLLSIGRFVKSPLFIAGIGILIFLVFFLNWPQHNDQKEKDIKTTSGIDNLTNEEIDQVDSLFGFKAKNASKVEDEIQSTTSSKYVITANLNTIKNENAKALYSSLITDYQIQKENNLFGNCNTTKNALFQTPLYKGVQAFPEVSTPHQNIRNESTAELYILAFEPRKKGKVYGVLIAPGRSISLNIELGGGVVFYSGQKMNRFSPIQRKNNGYGSIADSKRVNKNFNHHFCSQNIYNYQQLNRIYRVVKTEGTIIFEGLSTGSFRVKTKALELTS